MTTPTLPGIAPTSTRSPVRGGRHVWLWPGDPDKPDRWSKLDLPALANAMHAVGLRGVIVQDGMNTLAEIDQYGMVAIFNAANLEVCAGFGTNGPSHWQQLADVVSQALARPDLTGALIDWEGSWDNAQPQGQACVNAILAAQPNAADRTLDAPWWAPLNTPDGKPTHPSAPTAQFGQVCKRRFVQTYPGDALYKWRWAQDPTQYPHLGTPAANVRLAVSIYARALTDVVNSLIQDTGPVACWDWLEMDTAGRQGLQVVAALAALGYTGPSAVGLFQAAAGLTVDKVVGPKTLAALGVV